jgi:hypothetical protein
MLRVCREFYFLGFLGDLGSPVQIRVARLRYLPHEKRANSLYSKELALLFLVKLDEKQGFSKPLSS